MLFLDVQNFIKNPIQSQKVFFRYYRKKGFKRFLKENILETEGSNKTKALSIALGVFVGFSPVWGFHTIIILFLASFFKLNKLLSYMCTHVSAPPFIPFIIAGSLFMGAPFVHGETSFTSIEFNFDLIKSHLVQYLAGSIIMATTASIILGSVSFLLLEKLSPNKN